MHPHKKSLEAKASRLNNKDSGNVLLSRTVSHAVPSALEGLTSEFGMGSGMTPLL